MQLQGSNSRSANRDLQIDFFCLIADHVKYFFVIFANLDFLSARIFVFRETMKFLFTLQAQQFAYYLTPKC